MRLDLLGPLRVDGDEVALRRRDLVVLLALAVRPGETLSADRLADALWRGDAPPSWPKVVQGCVLRLRRQFGTDVIETTPGGYRLAIPHDGLDVRRFESFVERARAHTVNDEHDRAAVAFANALDLWRGVPFDALDTWSPAVAEATRLNETRQAAEEGLIESRVHLGEHRDLIGLAEAGVAEAPLREHRWALLALALYRNGRQADALRALTRARNTLIDQLGIEPGTELAELHAAILRQDEGLISPVGPPTITQHCPYKGLSPYEGDDADTFFGRAGEIAACLARVDTTPLLVIAGPSGCGKSSLVRAGVAPELRRRGHAVAVMQPGIDPDAAMTAAVTASGHPDAVLVVDQFEELFAFDDGTGVRAKDFCARIADYATGTAPVIIVVRADHLAHLTIDLTLAKLAERGMHLVRPLAGDELRQAIEAPAALCGLRLESGLVDLLVRDTEGEPGALPLLSHALAETWQRRDGRVLTVEGYRATGEIRGAVALTADRLYESLPVDQREKLRWVLMRLVSPTADGEPVRSRVATRTLVGDADRERLLGLLVGARLVIAERDSVELAHEAIARAWPRLRSWLDEDAAGQRIRRHLSAAADGWESLGRPDSELYRGARLELATEWRDAGPRDLTTDEEAFLDASVAAAESARRAAAVQARTHARQRRQIRRGLVAASLIVIASVVGGFALYRQVLAGRDQSRQAAIEGVASTAALLRPERRDVAALLAVEAHRLSPSVATESALFASVTSTDGLQSVASSDLSLGAEPATAMMPDGGSVLVTDSAGVVHRVDPTTGADRPFDPISDRGGRTAIALSADGHYAAGVWHSPAAPDHNLLTVWDTTTGEQRFAPVPVPYLNQSVAIDVDGSSVASAGAGPAIEVLDGATGTTRVRLDAVVDAGGDQAETVTFAPDGRLVILSRSGPIRFVDPTNGAVVDRLEGPARTSGVAAWFGPTGSVLVTVGTAGFVRFDLRLDDPQSGPLHALGGCRHVAPDWATAELWCATATGDLVAYGIGNGKEGRRIDTQLGPVCSLLATPGWTTVVTISSCADVPVVATWAFAGGTMISRVVYPSSQAHAVQAFGYSGHDSYLVAWSGLDGDSWLGPHDESVVIDPSNGEVIDRIPDAYGLTPTADPRIVRALFDDASIGLYDVARHLRTGPPADLGFPVDSWIEDGDRIVAQGHPDGTDATRLQGVDLETGRRVPPTIDIDEQYAYPVGIIDQSLYVTVTPTDPGALPRIERRDLDTGELLGPPAVGYGTVAIAGGVVVASTDDGQLLELDPETLQPSGLPFPGVTGTPVDWLTLDAGGRRLVAVGGTERKSVRLYDVDSRRQLGEPIDLGEMPFYDVVALRPDGLGLGVDSGRGVEFWDLDPQHWEDAACRLAGRNLTPAEWEQYLGDLTPYRATCPSYPTDA